MAVPKRHRSKSRQGNARMHKYLAKPTIGVCDKCGQPAQPHLVCKNCGFYRGNEVLDVLGKLDKKERKKKQKELEQQEHQRTLENT